MTEYECPSCDYTSEHEDGVAIHHKHKHGESIAKITVECENCGDSVERYKCDVETNSHKYCSEKCRDDHRSELPPQDQPAYKGGLQTVECYVCSSDISVTAYRVERSEHFFCSDECKSKGQSELFSRGQNPNGSKKKPVECDWCGCETQKLPRRIERSKKDFCSLECHGKWMSENQHGPNHHQWAGGRREYGPGWNESKRESVREREGRKCYDCGISESEHIESVGRKLDVHHVIPPTKTTNPAVHNAKRNLMALCLDCHRKRERQKNDTPTQPAVI